MKVLVTVAVLLIMLARVNFVPLELHGETASLVAVMTKCTVCIVLYHILASYSGHLCPGYKAISYPGHLS